VSAIDVYRNGVKMAPADFTATNGTSIVLANACTVGDTVEVISYPMITYSDAVKRTGDTMTGTLNVPMVVTNSSLMFRNRIINGDMRIDQRNAGASGTASNVYTADRWFYNASQVSKGTWQQNRGGITPPAGFTNYLGFTSSSAYSVLAADYFGLYQSIEGLNVADLAWGTANAQTVVLSFRVYSSLTGTFGGSVANSGFSRSYPFSYTISSANTWTTVSIVVPGDTTGTWLTTNGIGVTVNFSLGTGSTFTGTAGTWAGTNYISSTGATSIVGTNGATFYITGVQLEVGSVATPFERRPYGQELALCQRYYYEQSIDIQTPAAASLLQRYNFPVTMRTSPTISNKVAGNFFNISVVNDAGNTNNQGFYFQVSGSTANAYITARVNTVSAEL
jgi:hypothetical protein